MEGGNAKLARKSYLPYLEALSWPVRGSGSPKGPHESEDRGEGRGLGQIMGREGLALRRR